jgi:TM2 domain-containing membrane protein YozV
MDFNDQTTGINSILLQHLYNVSPEELVVINSHTKGFSDEQLSQFCIIYRAKRKDPQTILLLCLLGLILVAGVHRFVINQPGMGILYFFTGGLCLVGTIVDAINHQQLALTYNSQMIAETLSVLNMIRRN